MILEGSRLHYGAPRVVRTDDPDLALLLGDQLYALGLARLAALGDLDAVAELADVISLVAQAHAASDRTLADAVWEAGAVAIGWGSSDAHAAAKALARAGDRRAARCRAAARTAGRAGAGRRRLVTPVALLTIGCRPRSMSDRRRSEAHVPDQTPRRRNPSTPLIGTCPGRSRARRSRAGGS